MPQPPLSALARVRVRVRVLEQTVLLVLRLLLVKSESAPRAVVSVPVSVMPSCKRPPMTCKSRSKSEPRAKRAKARAIVTSAPSFPSTCSRARERWVLTIVVKRSCIAVVHVDNDDDGEAAAAARYRQLPCSNSEHVLFDAISVARLSLLSLFLLFFLVPNSCYLLLPPLLSFYISLSPVRSLFCCMICYITRPYTCNA
jgi:hypothetical protein